MAARGLWATSGVEDKRALQRVVPLHVEIDAELGVFRAIPGGLADEHRRPRDGREYGVAQRGGSPHGALVRLELRVSGVPDFQRPFAALDVESDWHALDGYHLADKLDEIADRPAQLAGIDLEERLLLLLGGLAVDVDCRFPVSLKYVARDVRDHREGRSRHVDVVDLSLVEVPGDDGVAGAVVGIFADPARAEHATVADFEQTSFKVVCHTPSV